MSDEERNKTNNKIIYGKVVAPRAPNLLQICLNPQRQPSGHLNLQKTLNKLSVWPVAAVIDCIRVLIGSNLQRSPFGDGDGQS